VVESLHDPEILAKRLRDRLRQTPALLVGVDGWIGAGKTRLAYCMACRTGSHVIDLDDFLDGTQGMYLERLDYNRLGKLIRRYRDAGGSIIIAGICILAVLQKLPLKLDVLIYVKRINDHGQWIDKGECDEQEGGTPTGHSFPESIATAGKQVSRYHREFRPRSAATVIFVRTV